MRLRLAFLMAVLWPALAPAAAAQDDAGLEAALAVDFESLRAADFRAFDPQYETNKALRKKRFRELEKRLLDAQAAGRDLPCSDQIYIEAKWLFGYTADWPRLDRRLSDLAGSLENPDQAFAHRQSPDDGAWGACYEEWFHKLDATIDGLNELAEQGRSPEHPFTFLNRIGTTDGLIAYLSRLLVSDIAHTGFDLREELGTVTAVLSEILFKEDLRRLFDRHATGLKISDAYVAAYRGFLDDWQDPRTGYWGAWYRSGQVVYKSADLSMTYHTVHYRHGQVEDLAKIAGTTLAVKQRAYPYGWLHEGLPNDHNSYDVVQLFRYGWPDMSEAQKTTARSEIGRLLDWTLTQSLRPNGSFVVDPSFYDRASDAYYFGVSFLAAAGYWDKSRRFWTDAAFPKARETCQAIKTRLEQLHFDDQSAAAALRELADC